jgi:hypothetical protein
MTIYVTKDWVKLVAAAAVYLAALASPIPAAAQTGVTAALNVQASFGTRLKVVFDRTAVTLDTQAYDPDTVATIAAAPLTVGAKARVTANTRVVLTLQADGPFQSGTDTIPANKLSWTIAGPGFQAGGTANPNAARMIGQWRGSGDWTGTQIYSFDDSWSYPVGVYALVMTYTFSIP